MAVSPVPDGYRTATPYLAIRNAAKAIEFYKKAFGAEEAFRMPGPDGQIMHAEIRIGDSMIMMAEESPHMICKSPESLGGSCAGVHLYVADVDTVYKAALAEGAKGNLEPMDAFWGDRFSQITDPFGHVWSIATHKEDLTPEQVDERSRAFAEQMQSK